jgi:hypothetical protein
VQYLLRLLFLAALVPACDRTPSTLLKERSIAVPRDATVELSAESVDALFAFARPVTAGSLVSTAQLEEALGFAPLSAEAWKKRGVDPSGPALFFCDAAACAFRPGGTWMLGDGELPAKIGDETWVVADRTNRVLVWGPGDEDALQTVVARWRSPEATRPPSSGADVAGMVNPAPLLERWELTSPRARTLVERATRQTKQIDFSAEVGDDAIDLTLDVVGEPGEPRFVDELGVPREKLRRVAGLVDSGVLGVVRLSADPERLWALGRSLLSADQRSQLDELLETLHTEAALDLQTALLDNVTGHIVVVAYGVDGDGSKSAAQWATLGGTREAVLIPIADPLPIRRLMDAWTQLSQGKLHVQETAGDHLQWAWLEEGELLWSVIVAEDYVVFVDSSVALEHAEQWETRPAPLSESLVKRGVDDLLDDAPRSGAYLDLAALRAIFGDRFGGWFPTVDAVTLVEDRSTRIRVLVGD